MIKKYDTVVVRTDTHDLGTNNPRIGQLEHIHAEMITEALNKTSWELDEFTTIKQHGEYITFLILVALR